MPDFKTCCLLALPLSLLGCQATRPPSLAPPTAVRPPAAGSPVLIIFYDVKTGDQALLRAAQEYKAKVVYQYHELHGIAVAIPVTATMEEAKRFFAKVPGVLSVEQDRVNTLY